jgi:hypothetical protein
MTAHHGAVPAGTFAVARGRNEGYRVLSAPAFLTTGAGVLTDLVSADRSGGGLVHGRSAARDGESVHVTYTGRPVAADDLDEAARALLGIPPLDRFGRPLHIVYGIAYRSPAPGPVPPPWIGRAEQDALAAFRAFAADETGYRVRTSPPIDDPAGHALLAAAAQSDRRPAPAGPRPPRGRPRLRQLTAGTWIAVVLTVAGAGFGGWAILDANRADERSGDPGSAVITNPRVASDECLPLRRGSPLTLSGTATTAKGTTLREITRRVDDGSLWPGPRARTRAAGSSWSLRIPSVGATGEAGHEYTILLVGADPAASRKLAVAAAAKPYKPLTGLPDGVEILAEMCVRRTG